MSANVGNKRSRDDASRVADSFQNRAREEGYRGINTDEGDIRDYFRNQNGKCEVDDGLLLAIVKPGSVKDFDFRRQHKPCTACCISELAMGSTPGAKVCERCTEMLRRIAFLLMDSRIDPAYLALTGAAACIAGENNVLFRLVYTGEWLRPLVLMAAGAKPSVLGQAKWYSGPPFSGKTSKCSSSEIFSHPHIHSVWRNAIGESAHARFAALLSDNEKCQQRSLELLMELYGSMRRSEFGPAGVEEPAKDAAVTYTYQLLSRLHARITNVTEESLVDAREAAAAAAAAAEKATQDRRAAEARKDELEKELEKAESTLRAATKREASRKRLAACAQDRVIAVEKQVKSRAKKR